MAILLCILVLLTIGVSASQGLRTRADVLNQLIEQTNPNVIPLDSDTPLDVSLSVKLLNIEVVNEDEEQVELTLWLGMRWNVPVFGWKKYVATIDEISVPASLVWVPDLTILNSISYSDLFVVDRVVVGSDGAVTFVPSLKVKVKCQNLRHFQGATCRLRAGSWTHSTKDVTLSVPEGADPLEYFQSDKYSVQVVSQTVKDEKYSCCKNTYDELSLVFTVRDKSLND
ncbi:acetylcholine-binding protein-like isoform X1 [Biomphalaria pfeifferi]|uniref:Acetylcholine-binding protein-like isoform X1 n=1 Tax=Biomphalaria pfeifferi TaxID=112525 RepID=A0AAD8B559_BIOPF|nr:acetylcholine-binding protein-like isoform X1 [Biomphalaria pfeifferi]